MTSTNPPIRGAGEQPENWRERLDRVEAIVASNSEQIAATQRQVDANSLAIADLALRTDANSTAISRLEAAQTASNQRMDDLTERVNILSERVSDLTRMVEQVSRIALATFQRIDAMQSEIRELQTENQRVLDILKGGQDGQQ
ncbi:hypothetical protein [Gloeobacter kilaueensis]|nr:hypothetical protein [Gloeobacter kilaueensis]